jgi:hypothetical protein
MSTARPRPIRLASLGGCLLALLWAYVAPAEGQGGQGRGAAGGTISAPDYERFGSLFGQSTERSAPRWSSDQYDPQPAAGRDLERELTLPMPCGGAMVLRRVETGGRAGWLGEQALRLGAASDADAPLDHGHLEYLAGGLGEPGDSSGRYYFLGKYEVTDLQYRVVVGPCPERLAGRLPVARISWHDAVGFTRRYTEWLYANARDALPEEDGVRGFVRLPTETEWEFAARGGRAVDAAAFRADLFPMPEGTLEDYAWFRESVSSSYRPRPIGALRPNPLGLYDMLGNVAEVVLEPFRLIRAGHLHGQAGGSLVKGGHFRSWRNSLRSSWRREQPLFDPRSGKPSRLSTVGFRVVVSVPVLTSTARVRAIRAEWLRTQEAEGRGGNGSVE